MNGFVVAMFDTDTNRWWALPRATRNQQEELYVFSSETWAKKHAATEERETQIVEIDLLPEWGLPKHAAFPHSEVASIVNKQLNHKD